MTRASCRAVGMNEEKHSCTDDCLEERAQLKALDAHFCACLAGTAQLRMHCNEKFECPRVEREYETLLALCSVAEYMVERADMRNEEL